MFLQFFRGARQWQGWSQNPGAAPWAGGVPTFTLPSGGWPGEGAAGQGLLLSEALAYFAHPHRVDGHTQTPNLRAARPSPQALQTTGH